MASGSAEHPWRRGGRSQADGEPEEGDQVDAGSHSETDTEEYYNRCSSLSDETITDTDGGGETASSIPAPANGFAAAANATSSVALGWGVTGRRGFTGSSAAARAAVTVSPTAEPEQPVAAIVAAVPEVVVLHPMPPLAFATPTTSSPVPMASATVTASLSIHSSGGAQRAHGDAMEVTVAVAANHHPTTSPPPPSPVAAATGGEDHAVVVVHQSAAAAAAAGGRGQQIPKVYTCKRCGVTFTNPQALGGHVVGHRNRDLAAAAAAGTTMSPADGCGMVPGGRRGGAPKPERPHVCNKCGAEFLTGVQLGGHKRKHWTGAPIVPKKKNKTRVVVLVQPQLPPPAEAVADLALALPVNAADEAAPPAVETTPGTAVERTPELALPRSSVAGRVLLFGIDIGTGKKMPEAQQGSPVPESSPPSDRE